MGDPDIQKGFRHFTINDHAIFVRVRSKATCLCPPFDNFMNFETKCLLGHSGSWSTITEQKLRLLSVLCDASDNDTPYNWRVWFIHQLVKASKSIRKEVNKAGKPTGQLEFLGKLKFAMWISYCLEESWPA